MNRTYPSGCDAGFEDEQCLDPTIVQMRQFLAERHGIDDVLDAPHFLAKRDGRDLVDRGLIHDDAVGVEHVGYFFHPRHCELTRLVHWCGPRKAGSRSPWSRDCAGCTARADRRSSPAIFRSPGSFTLSVQTSAYEPLSLTD
jgi:hypothetical protein